MHCLFGLICGRRLYWRMCRGWKWYWATRSDFHPKPNWCLLYFKIETVGDHWLTGDFLKTCLGSDTVVRGTCREVTEVNTELVSASLHCFTMSPCTQPVCWQRTVVTPSAPHRNLHTSVIFMWTMFPDGDDAGSPATSGLIWCPPFMLRCFLF